jgi:formate dehydrogenase beta subunit
VDAPVAICALKRFVADYETKDEGRKTEEGSSSSFVLRPSSSPPRVAIIGAGPAGLSAAYFLAKEDIACEVFEALPVAGGMMAVGIPAYRLPPDVLQGEIAAIESLGVTIHLNHPVDAAEWERLRRDYAAIFVAVGAHKSQPLNIPGEDLPGVLSGINFLRDVSRTEHATRNTSHSSNVKRQTSNMKRGTWNLERVVVIGGGNVAIDSAMTARRLGARDEALSHLTSRNGGCDSASEERGGDGEIGTLLTHPAELALIRQMLRLPELVEEAATRLEPHHLPHYAQELAASFHSFYKQCRVVSSDPADAALSAARLKLVQAARIVLANTLYLMGMAAPEQM